MGTSCTGAFQPVLHDWCNKGRGMCYPVCGMVHIKEPLLLIDKSSLCGGSRFPFSLPYVRRHITVDKMCWNASLNKTFLSLSPALGSVAGGESQWGTQDAFYSALKNI